MKPADLLTHDLITCRLKLLDELVFTPQRYGNATYCHIEVPSEGRFFRVGYAEYVLISLVDGQRTLAQALTLSARALGAEAPSQREALDVALWLLESGLARLADSATASQSTTREASGKRTSALRNLNPFWAKIPLADPEGLLTRIVPLCGWLIAPWMMAAGLLPIAAGAFVVATHWDQFVASSHLIFAPHNWLSMLLVWLALKIVHESAHALACKRYGGEVREAGIIFILFAPAAFVDVTSAWRFPSRWQRLHVAAAGMYVELVLAGLAALVWSHADSQVLRHLLFNTIVMASVSTLVFNANPLMRFDGYYLLADALEIPNLATEGSRFFRQLAARLFFGQAPATRALLGARGWVVRVYGLAAWLWRMFVCVSLLAAASVLFKGAGLALGLVGAFCWFGLPIVQLLRELHRHFCESPLLLLRAGLVSALTAAAACLLLCWVPWPASITAPMVVDYTDLSIVRSRTDGFVASIYVRAGMHVNEGELLLELRNDELEAEYGELQSSISRAELLHRAAVGEHDAGQAQVAWRNRQAMLERLGELEQQRSSLRVCAPVTGRIVARGLENRIGTFVREGTELLAVGDERRKRLLVSISHEQIDHAAERVGRPVKFRRGDLHLYDGTLTRVEPRASRHLPHPALSAAVGGPLAVSDVSGQGETELLEPRFLGDITLSPQISVQQACGDRGYAIFGLSRESVGQHIWNGLSRWLYHLDKLRRQ